MIVAANFKTNLTRFQTGEYLAELENNIADIKNTDVFVFPATSSLIKHKGKAKVGAQNAYAAKSGAFTGEIGLVHLEEFGIKTVLIGHSERREILKESQVDVAKKFEFFKNEGFEIIYCVGESLKTRQKGEDEVLEFIKSQFEGIDLGYEKLTIAYEPIWAIGTGLTPSLEEIESLHKSLKNIADVPLLYGGSVKLNNAKEIMALPSVDGVLVGSASLKVEDFSQMVKIAEELN